MLNLDLKIKFKYVITSALTAVIMFVYLYKKYCNFQQISWHMVAPVTYL